MHNKLQMHNHNSGITAAQNKSGGNADGLFDVLPKQFVASMKTLFDILDDRGTGFVKLVDIEAGWQDDGSKGLPRGVIDSLRKVTPATGMLSFDRFCAGLKICLLRNQNHQPQAHLLSGADAVQTTDKIRRLSSDNLIMEKTSSGGGGGSGVIQPIRPPSAPALDINNPSLAHHHWNNNTATVRPNNAMQKAQRALSLPQLSPDSDLEPSESIILMHHRSNIYANSPPPKPPRSAIINSGQNTGMDKAEIRHALQNWQMGVLMNEMDAKDKNQIYPVINNQQIIRGTADGGTIEFITSSSSSPPSSSSSSAAPATTLNSNQQQQPQSPTSAAATTSTTNVSLFHSNSNNKKPNIKRREPRRHTLQNGIDYNLLKRLKQFEGERDVLLQGLSAVEKARDWYVQQLSNVQEKMKHLGRMGSHVIQWSEVHQERLDFQRARVLEINRHLSTLSDIPLHMNLAVRHEQQSHHGHNQLVPPPLPPLPLDRFKQHHHHLHHHHLLINDLNNKNMPSLFETDSSQILKRNRTAQIGLPSNLVHSDMTF